MKYLNSSFTMPTCSKPMSDLEYDFAVGKITEAQYELGKAALATAEVRLDNLKNMCFSS